MSRSGSFHSAPPRICSTSNKPEMVGGPARRERMGRDQLMFFGRSICATRFRVRVLARSHIGECKTYRIGGSKNGGGNTRSSWRRFLVPRPEPGANRVADESRRQFSSNSDNLPSWQRRFTIEKIGRWGFAIGVDSVVCDKFERAIWRYKLEFWAEDGCSSCETIAPGGGLQSLSQARLLLAGAVRLARLEDRYR